MTVAIGAIALDPAAEQAEAWRKLGEALVDFARQAGGAQGAYITATFGDAKISEDVRRALDKSFAAINAAQRVAACSMAYVEHIGPSRKANPMLFEPLLTLALWAAVAFLVGYAFILVLEAAGVTVPPKAIKVLVVVWALVVGVYLVRWILAGPGLVVVPS